MKLKIFKIKEKTEAGLNMLISTFLLNTMIKDVIYREDYIAFVYEE